MTAISIIIPTHNRCNILPRTLNALGRQIYPMNSLEVVVVADGCQDGTAEFLATYIAPFQLKVVEQAGLGAAAARNAGAAAATGQLLIFMDDDVETTPEFVAGHLAAQNNQPGVVIGYLPPVLEGQSGLMAADLRRWWEETFAAMRQPGHRFTYTDLLTGNFSISADLFHELGGFDATLRCREDYELGMRLHRAVVPFSFSDQALGYHHEIADLHRTVQRKLQEGKADVQLGRKYPELRPVLLVTTLYYYSLLPSRLTRELAFHWPQGGDWLMKLPQWVAPWLAYWGLRLLWQRTLQGMMAYWYWRGVSQELRSLSEVAEFVEEKNGVQVHTDEHGLAEEVVVDLARGVETAVSALDTMRPSAMRLMWGKRWVADIPPLPGTEPLRGIHLRAALASSLGPAWLVAQWIAQTPWQETAVSLPPVNARPVHLYQPKYIAQIDLSHPPVSLDITGYECLHALIKYHGAPYGWLTRANLQSPFISPETLNEAVTQEWGWQLATTPLTSSLTHAQPAISVIVCTRNRTNSLKNCLHALSSLNYPNYEIVVIDNASVDSSTAQLAATLPVRYVREERPGLDWARNRGIATAQYSIVAFTDDDACPDANWLNAIARAFSEPEVMAVTGSVVPAELETEAQNLFEFGYGGMNHGFQRRIWRKAELTTHELLWASGCGVGANMAFRRELFCGGTPAQIGGFDVALDVGTPSGGGGDVEMFHRVVAGGHTLVYEPAALVWHSHRREMADLKRLVWQNGRSFGCYLFTCGQNGTVGWSGIVYFALVYWLWGWIGRRLIRPYGFPRSLIWRELAGAVSSLWAYWQTHKQAQYVAARFGEDM